MSFPIIQIRKAKLQDVDAIVRLTNAGGPDGKPRLELPAVLPATYDAAFAAIDADPNQLLMVAEQNESIVGTFHLTYLVYLAGAGRPDAQIEAVISVWDSVSPTKERSGESVLLATRSTDRLN